MESPVSGAPTDGESGGRLNVHRRLHSRASSCCCFPLRRLPPSAARPGWYAIDLRRCRDRRSVGRVGPKTASIGSPSVTLATSCDLWRLARPVCRLDGEVPAVGERARPGGATRFIDFGRGAVCWSAARSKLQGRCRSFRRGISP